LRERLFKFSSIIGPLIIGFCAACVPADAYISPKLLPTAEYLEQHPLRTPAFWVRSYAATSVDGKATHCVEINQTALNSEVTVQFRVDDRPIEISSTYTGGRAVLGDNESYSAYKWVCFSTQELSLGLHLAQIEVMAQSGKNDTHTWVFRIGDGAQAQGQPTLAVLPIATP